MTQQGLTNVQNAVPHVRGPMLSDDGWNNFAQARRTYDEWTLEAGTELLGVFADRSVAGRLRGDRYDAIMHRQFSADRHANLMHTELQELRTYFMELANELRRIQESFSRHRVRTVVLDTNDLLHYMRFDKIPWQRIYGAGTSVMIPHVVIDEIDKKSYDTHDTGVRKRARAVFALLERVLTQIEKDGQAVVNNGETDVDVLRDEPGHVRLPNNDDEIVARACYLQQAIAPAPVTVVTGDNGMRARALSWGLKARVLDEKYRIERLSAAEKAANEQAITFEVPADGDG
ncbi:PIN domain-containing protein [Streptomyces doebereineriae]|uniref:PIN domain-containing protein n=1 Tax=Streptomyces doebereineriae TaxID=3075528 RepID=A0ABU2VK78_9ACTN|nr:PIN domain-containing protein [Streptomyces sp. DSM 41640]MDT0485307.1 PIN domain-containing protein [Streptomyces sp. DSM 41640]